MKQSLNYQESCIIQTFNSPKVVNLCWFNLYKLNTSLFWTLKLIQERFGLGRYHCRFGLGRYHCRFGLGRYHCRFYIKIFSKDQRSMTCNFFVLLYLFFVITENNIKFSNKTSYLVQYRKIMIKMCFVHDICHMCIC